MTVLKVKDSKKLLITNSGTCYNDEFRTRNSTGKMQVVVDVGSTFVPKKKQVRGGKL